MRFVSIYTKLHLCDVIYWYSVLACRYGRQTDIPNVIFFCAFSTTSAINLTVCSHRIRNGTMSADAQLFFHLSPTKCNIGTQWSANSTVNFKWKTKWLDDERRMYFSRSLEHVHSKWTPIHCSLQNVGLK